MFSNLWFGDFERCALVIIIIWPNQTLLRVFIVTDPNCIFKLLLIKAHMHLMGARGRLDLFRLKNCRPSISFHHVRYLSWSISLKTIFQRKCPKVNFWIENNFGYFSSHQWSKWYCLIPVLATELDKKSFKKCSKEPYGSTIFFLFWRLWIFFRAKRSLSDIFSKNLCPR